MNGDRSETATVSTATNYLRSVSTAGTVHLAESMGRALAGHGLPERSRRAKTADTITATLSSIQAMGPIGFVSGPEGP